MLGCNYLYTLPRGQTSSLFSLAVSLSPWSLKALFSKRYDFFFPTMLLPVLLFVCHLCDSRFLTLSHAALYVALIVGWPIESGAPSSCRSPALHLFLPHHSGVDGLLALQGPTLTEGDCPGKALTHTHKPSSHAHMCHVV